MKTIVRRIRQRPAWKVALALGMLVTCGEEPTNPPQPVVESLVLSPKRIVLFAGEAITFTARADSTSIAVTWHIVEGRGSIDAGGVYTAPATTADSSLAVIEARASGSPTPNGRARVLVLADTSLRSCYARDVRPILQSSCALAACHDAASRQRGFDFSSDAGVQRAVTPGDPETSLMHVMITHPDDNRKMPPAPRLRLSPSAIATITRWIEQGASLTRCDDNGTPDCDTTNVTYSAVVQPIMQAWCVGCHPTSSDPEVIPLDTYEGVRAVAASGQLLGSIMHAPGYEPMPTRSTKIPECDILRIRAWIDAGAKND